MAAKEGVWKQMIAGHDTRLQGRITMPPYIGYECVLTRPRVVQLG